MLLAVALAVAALPTEAELFGALFAELDPDGDGAITAEEYAARDTTPGAFATMDADRDGAVRLAELIEWARVTQPRPMDRPPQVAAVLASGGVAPAAPPAPAAAPRELPAPGAAPAPPDPWPRRLAVLGAMLAVAAPAAWWILRAPAPKRRRR